MVFGRPSCRDGARTRNHLSGLRLVRRFFVPAPYSHLVRIQFLLRASLRPTWLLLVALSCLSAACRTSPPDERRPNVVLIISDDQAWTDFGFMGHPEIDTPHLDRLAADSAVFERGYVPSSLCRPSLATMITGLYPHEHRITGNDPPKGVPRERMLLHIERVATLPELLAPLGYRSLQTGKWWEGNCRCGGFTDGMTHGDPERGGRHGDEGLKIGRATMQPIVDFLDRVGDQPFFLWYAPILPHEPHEPPERLLQHYRGEGRSLHVARYYAMCEWFDETCGQLLGELDRRGLRDDTLVLFAVDNGWIQRPDRRGFADRSKRSPYDGGLRTPILVSWPGHVAPGRVDSLASTVDLAPTVLRAVGAAVPPEMSGCDLVAIAGGREAPRDEVHGATFTHDVVDVDRPARSMLYRWIRRGDWKLLVPRDGAKVELYDVAADPFEQRECSEAEPARVDELRRALDAWWTADDR